MPDSDRLRATLARIDGRPYPAYRDLGGPWRLGDVLFTVDRVQGDPFAAPSRVRVRCAHGIDPNLWGDADGRLAVEDWLLRRVGDAVRPSRRGSGRSGTVEVYAPGPEVVERTALRLFDDGTAELRFAVGLPAKGRRILGREADALVFDDVLGLAAALRSGEGLDAHVASVRRQRALRRALGPAGLVAFVADGSVLPRASGVDPSPLTDAVPFVSPDALQVSLEVPGGAVQGMGIRPGVTLITGGGFHGKSTLLDAVAGGVVDRVPGDGREAVVALSSAMRVRAEDGRAVHGVDVSGFLHDLPGGRATEAFCTADASGSTSQATAIVEAVESGATLLLIDEDTSATNLLVRDSRMRQLIPREAEPITPLVERVRQLHDVWGVSTLMVVGGVGDFLAVADRVVSMVAFSPQDVTAKAQQLAGPAPEPPGELRRVAPRVFDARGLDARKIRARTPRLVSYGDTDLDLGAVGPPRDVAHARSIALLLRWFGDNLLDGRRDVAAALDALDAILDDEGIEVVFEERPPGGFVVRPSRFEVAAALSRLRTARVRPRPDRA